MQISTSRFLPSRPPLTASVHSPSCDHCDTPEEKFAMRVVGAGFLGFAGLGALAKVTVEALPVGPLARCGVIAGAAVAGAAAGIWLDYRFLER